jgi:predicted acyltransferase
MQKQRIHSIGIFRGLTIFLMVLVNELAGVSGTPAWMKHVPPDVDGMTFVVYVFRLSIGWWI